MSSFVTLTNLDGCYAASYFMARGLPWISSPLRLGIYFLVAISSARRRCEGAGWRPQSSSLSPRPDPLLRADGASAPVSTRPLSSPNPRQALPGKRGRAGFWHRNCSQAGAASLPGRGGASVPGASGPAPGLLANPWSRGPQATADTPYFNGC